MYFNYCYKQNKSFGVVLKSWISNQVKQWFEDSELWIILTTWLLKTLRSENYLCEARTPVFVNLKILLKGKNRGSTYVYMLRLFAFHYCTSTNLKCDASASLISLANLLPMYFDQYRTYVQRIVYNLLIVLNKNNSVLISITTCISNQMKVIGRIKTGSFQKHGFLKDSGNWKIIRVEPEHLSLSTSDLYWKINSMGVLIFYYDYISLSRYYSRRQWLFLPLPPNRSAPTVFQSVCHIYIYIYKILIIITNVHFIYSYNQYKQFGVAFVHKTWNLIKWNSDSKSDSKIRILTPVRKLLSK